ncbi:Uncharacterised protein [Mycobacterium tuberculosis]|nr:Uncharacterised protein [Mycobacterium tuberculosis]CNV68661.1 Uncharacterised protein [Mycobacterium tuberculosis]CNV82982.1 Uncharacterised protein [Mycobacterium tuberculosis]
MRRLLPRRDRLPGPVQQHRHQPPAVAVGRAHEGLPRVVGIAGLAAERARIVVEQLVVVLQLVAWMVAVPREVEGAGRDDVGEDRVLPRVPVEQADVIGRRAHAGPVQSGRRGHSGVPAAQLGGQQIDFLQRGRHAAELPGQRVRSVVAGVHQQPVQQLVDGVGATGVHPDFGALDRRVVGGSGDRLVEGERVDGRHRHQHLDDAGRAVPAVRIPGGDHRAAVQVRHQPGLG